MELPDILKLLKAHLQQPKAKSRELSLEQLYKLAQGDQWQDGDMWRGRKSKENSTKAIEPVFTQDDIVTPALRRCISAFCGRDWEWQLKPDSERELNSKEKELEEALSVWHYDVQLGRVFAEAFYLAKAMGKSYIRTYTPDEYGEQDPADFDTASAIDAANTLSEAFELTHPQVLDARHAGMVRDEHGRTVAAYYRYKRQLEQGEANYIELHTPEWIYRLREDTFEYVSEQGKQGPVVYRRPNPAFDPKRKRKPRFMIVEIDLGDPAVTLSILDKQNRLNVTWTNLARNDDLAGFRSAYTINAEGPTTIDVNGLEEQAEWTLGPDTIIELLGLPKELGKDAQGNDVVIDRYQAEIGFIPPIDPDSFLKAINAYRESIILAFNQGFILQEFKATSSLSKKEDRRAFDQQVIQDAAVAVDVARTLLETVTAYASAIINKPNDFTGLSFEPKFFVDVPKGDIESYLALIPAYEKNLLSLESLLNYAPVDDKGQEQERLEEEARERAALPSTPTPPTPPQPTEPEQENA